MVGKIVIAYLMILKLSSSPTISKKTLDSPTIPKHVLPIIDSEVQSNNPSVFLFP